MKDKLKLIKEKCIEANPEIFLCANCQHSGKGHYSTRIGNAYCSKKYFTTTRPIQLTDVLMAMKDSDVEFAGKYKKDGLIFADKDDIEPVWNLKETLDNQSEETKNFLYEIFYGKR